MEMQILEWRVQSKRKGKKRKPEKGEKGKVLPS